MPGYTVTQCLIFRESARLFSKHLHPFTFPPAMQEGSDFSTSSPTAFFFIPAVLTCVKWCMFVVLLCISLMGTDDGHLPFAYWPFVYIFLVQCLFRPFSDLSFCYWVVRVLYIFSIWVPYPGWFGRVFKKGHFITSPILCLLAGELHQKQNIASFLGQSWYLLEAIYIPGAGENRWDRPASHFSSFT